MAQDKSLLIFVAVILMLVFFPFSMFFSIFDNAYTGYKNVVASPDSSELIYSSTVSLDNQWVYNEHAFKPSEGNIEGFTPFYRNQQFLKFYLSSQGINPNDFNFLAGDGNNIPYGCILQPNYCSMPSTSSNTKITYASLDSDGCPHYAIQQTSNRCCCRFGYTTCENPGYSEAGDFDIICLGAGSTTPGFRSDCSSYNTVDNDFGGATVSKNYLSKLQSIGINYNEQYNCYMAEQPSTTVINDIKANYSCLVEGNIIKTTSVKSVGQAAPITPIPYSVKGSISEYSSSQGFVCTIDSSRIESLAEGYKMIDGYVIFSKYLNETAQEDVNLTIQDTKEKINEILDNEEDNYKTQIVYKNNTIVKYVKQPASFFEKYGIASIIFVVMGALLILAIFWRRR